jgi:hypothetical protein
MNAQVHLQVTVMLEKVAMEKFPEYLWFPLSHHH